MQADAIVIKEGHFEGANKVGSLEMVRNATSPRALIKKKASGGVNK